MSDLRIISQAQSLSTGTSGNYKMVEGTKDGSIYTADFLLKLGMMGKIFTASAATVNATAIVGQTSFVNTTPTFLLRIPSGTIGIPLAVNLVQDGTVAGGTVNVHLGFSTTDPYSSGGTTITPVNHLTSGGAANATWTSNPTTSAITTGRHRSWVLGQDVSPAEGAPNGIFWKPEAPILLYGAAAMWIFSWAATTGPGWDVNVTWAEIPTTAIGA